MKTDHAYSIYDTYFYHNIINTNNIDDKYQLEKCDVDRDISFFVYEVFPQLLNLKSFFLMFGCLAIHEFRLLRG